MDRDIGRILKERRKEKDWTLTQLSRASGVSVAHIGRIESGKRLPSAPILRELAEPLGFTQIELFKLAGLLSSGTDRKISSRKANVELSFSMLTPSDVAHLLGIHVNTVRRWSNKGLLTAYRISSRGDRRFRQDDIDRFLNER